MALREVFGSLEVPLWRVPLWWVGVRCLFFFFSFVPCFVFSFFFFFFELSFCTFFVYAANLAIPVLSLDGWHCRALCWCPLLGGSDNRITRLCLMFYRRVWFNLGFTHKSGCKEQRAGDEVFSGPRQFMQQDSETTVHAAVARVFPTGVRKSGC